jgi:hypothetical protein
MQSFTFFIRSLALCGPAAGCVPDIRAAESATWQEEGDIDAWAPEDDFLPKRTFKRLSRLSKMALYAAHYAQEGSPLASGSPVFCSRYGEFLTTMRILDDIRAGVPASPMDFSHSVHNTAQGLFSVWQKQTRPAAALAAREGVIEQAAAKAYAQLRQGDAAVLTVYHEDVLSPPYRENPAPPLLPLALAMMISEKPEGAARRVELSFSPGDGERQPPVYGNRHEHALARLLASGTGELTLSLNRLSWTWRCERV